MKHGMAYGIGVGPGDPELMTLKAVRLIRQCDVIAVPGEDPRAAVAYRIAAGAVPEIAEKELIPISTPMIRDRARIDAEHRKSAKRLETCLDRGQDVAYITLGDPTVYCTFSNIQRYLEADGYETRLVSGIPSFCAAAARLNLPLAEWDELLHVMPAAHMSDAALDAPGNYVLMKSASRMKAVKDRLRESGRRVWMVENCGMPEEKTYRGADAIPDDAGYFSLIIAKEHD